MIGITTEKIETRLWNEEMEPNLRGKLKGMKRMINNFFYLEERQSMITVETRRTKSGYGNRIIRNEKFNFLNEPERELLGALETLGQKKLAEMPTNEVTRSHCETFLYRLDLFGIKRLGKYFK